MAFTGWQGPKSDRAGQPIRGRHGPSAQLRGPAIETHRSESETPHSMPPHPPEERTQYRSISASGEARQHNGNVYNTNAYHYTIRQRSSDETLREDQRGAVLLKAAAEGQTPRVKRLLTLGADIDYRDEDEGYTALHHAVLSGFEEVVDALLEAGADVNAQSQSDITSLHLAALKGRANVTHLLLRYRANLHAASDWVGYPLHCAVFYGDVEICSALIERGAKVDVSAWLCYGDMQQKSRNDKALAGSQIASDCYPIDVAIDRGTLGAVQMLLDRGASTSFPCQCWIPPYVHGASTNLAGTQRNLRGVRPLLRAACLDHPAILQLLIEKGIDILIEDDHGMNAVMYASLSGQAACLEYLINVLTSMTSIKPPAARGPITLVEYITGKCKDGYGALDLSVHHEHHECVRVICGSDTSLSESRSWGPSPLHLACEQCTFDVAVMLLDKGFDVNSEDESGYTPILHPAFGRRFDQGRLILTLADRGANLDVTARNGRNLAWFIL